MGGGQAGTRADAAAAGVLVFAVLAGWRRIPSPSATASGSPNRLLCPDPVRHMSVISGSVEPTTVCSGAYAVGSNVYPMPVQWDVLAGQHGINERNPDRWGRSDGD